MAVAHKNTPQSGVFLCIPGQTGKAATNYLAAEASAAGAAAGAAEASAAGAGAAGAAASSFLPQADKAAAAMMAAKTRDLFMMIFPCGLKTISGNCRKQP
jgi:predicted lipid-binding transport protein (Tim44 family)